MKITMIRHGETIANAANILQGQVDGKLSELGIRQVTETAKNINLSDYDAILCSDLGRTKETLALLMGHQKLPVLFTEELREINLGIYENTPKGTLEIEATKQKCDLVDLPLPEGESIFQQKKRLKITLAKYKDEYKDKHIFIVSHGGVITNFILSTFNLDNSFYDKYDVRNSSLSILNFDAENILEKHNQIFY